MADWWGQDGPTIKRAGPAVAAAAGLVGLTSDWSVKTVMTNEEKAQALLGSPTGSALVLDVSANLDDHPLEHFADPKVSFWLAAMAVDFCDVHRDAGFQEIALREARTYRDLARRIFRVR